MQPGVLTGRGAERDGLALLQFGLGCDHPASLRVTRVVPLRATGPRATAHPFSNGGSCPSGRLTTASGLRHPSEVAEYLLRLPDARPSPAVSQLEPECPRETDAGRIRAARGEGDKFLCGREIAAARSSDACPRCHPGACHRDPFLRLLDASGYRRRVSNPNLGTSRPMGPGNKCRDDTCGCRHDGAYRCLAPCDDGGGCVVIPGLVPGTHFSACSMRAGIGAECQIPTSEPAARWVPATSAGMTVVAVAGVVSARARKRNRGLKTRS